MKPSTVFGITTLALVFSAIVAAFTPWMGVDAVCGLGLLSMLSAVALGLSVPWE